jgi:hypothetical protein
MATLFGESMPNQWTSEVTPHVATILLMSL